MVNQFRLLNYLDSTNENSFDSIEIINDTIRARLKYYSATNTGMITDPKIPPNMLISDDSLFRIYVWEDAGGGAISFYFNIFQYKYKDKLYTRDNYDPALDGPNGNGVYYTKIYSIKGDEGTLYLARSSTTPSHNAGMETIRIFRIDGTSLNETLRLIQAYGDMVNSLDVEYDASKLDIPASDCIQYDPLKKIITIADMSEDGIFTHHFIRYQFNGKYFEPLDSK